MHKWNIDIHKNKGKSVSSLIKLQNHTLINDIFSTGMKIMITNFRIASLWLSFTHKNYCYYNPHLMIWLFATKQYDNKIN